MDDLDWDKSFTHDCKEATKYLGKVTHRLDQEPEVEGADAMSLMLLLIAVGQIETVVDDDSEESDYKWDDDHTFE